MMLMLMVVGGPLAAGAETEATHQFSRDVAPFLKKYCTDCHGGENAESNLPLDRFQESGEVQEFYTLWEKVARAVSERQMPPADAEQPTEQEALEFLSSVKAEMETFDCAQVHKPGRITIQRLNRAEYDNTIRDLLAVDFHPAKDFPADDVGYGFDNIGDILSMPPVLMEKYLEAAEQVIQLALASESSRKLILPEQPQNDEERVDVFKRNITQFAERAYRRPLQPAEQERLFELAAATFRAGYPPEEIVHTVCVAVLASSNFLFRIEDDRGRETEASIRDLDDWELASRLSYFLWSSMPDRELFELARQGKLRQPEVLTQQAQRMLQDAKAEALVDNFAGQWLQLRDVTKKTPDPETFPNVTPDLQQAMRRETEQFFLSVIREDRSILDFLTADYTFVNELLARHYGLEGITGNEFQRVPLPPQRKGILTQASILLLTSNPTRTSPVKRGKWILDNLLNEPPPAPPPNVPELEEGAEVLGTLRERLEQHRANPACAVCHRTMDALGFGLENFDAVGAWRSEDGSSAIDPSGALPGGIQFGGPTELMDVLVQQKKEAFCRCFAEKLLTYALGRGLNATDRCAVNEVLEQMEAGENRFSAAVTGIVLSPAFRQRETQVDDE